MIKEMMIRGMDVVMLNCEEATYLITKSELTKLGCVKRMQMKMHLMGCELCRRFKQQSEFINKNLEQLEIKNQNLYKHKLPDIKKKELQSLVETNFPS